MKQFHYALITAAFAALSHIEPVVEAVPEEPHLVL